MHEELLLVLQARSGLFFSLRVPLLLQQGETLLPQELRRRTGVQLPEEQVSQELLWVPPQRETLFPCLQVHRLRQYRTCGGLPGAGGQGQAEEKTQEVWFALINIED
jgi:hypothetical protein